jgi:hypothetical protein
LTLALFFVVLLEGPATSGPTAVLDETGDRVADDGEDGSGEGERGGELVLVLVLLILGFLARRVRSFSSSSDDGYGAVMSRSSGILSRASCASVPYEGARLTACLDDGTVSLGIGPQKDSQRRTRWTRGSAAIGGRPPVLLRLILELEVVEEVMEAERRRRRG